MFTLPPLPYSYNALEPYIDEETMKLHHDKHHGTYVTNLNTAVSPYADLMKKSVEDILINIDSVPESIRQTVVNQGGGHANHSLFWELLSPKKNEKPSGSLSDALVSKFGSLASFQEQFTTSATKIFGSGWAFLVVTKDKKLEIETHSNQDSPLMRSHVPVLALDVWEHAYYLRYQNRRPEYIQAWWNVINWTHAGKLFQSAVV